MKIRFCKCHIIIRNLTIERNSLQDKNNYLNDRVDFFVDQREKLQSELTLQENTIKERLYKEKFEKVIDIEKNQTNRVKKELERKENENLKLREKMVEIHRKYDKILVENLKLRDEIITDHLIGGKK